MIQPIEIPADLFGSVSLAREPLARALFASAQVVPDAFVTETRSEYNPAGTKPLLMAMLPCVQAIAGKNIYPVCTFSRVSAHGATLLAHTDRPGLHWTVSMCLDADAPWPLEGQVDGEWKSVTPTPQHAVLTHGISTPHRKQVFSGQRHVTLLLHYAEDVRYAWDQKPAPGAAPYRLIRGVLSSGDIARIYAGINGAAFAPSMVHEYGGQESIRTSTQLVLHRPEWQWLYEKARGHAERVNSEEWGLDISGPGQEMQFTRYEKTQHFGWHPDVDDGSTGATAQRTLSASVLMRAASDGGLLELRGEDRIDAYPGDAIFFPARTYHRVTPVIEGVRESLVIWMTKP